MLFFETFPQHSLSQVGQPRLLFITTPQHYLQFLQFSVFFATIPQQFFSHVGQILLFINTYPQHTFSQVAHPSLFFTTFPQHSFSQVSQPSLRFTTLSQHRLKHSEQNFFLLYIVKHFSQKVSSSLYSMRDSSYIFRLFSYRLVYLVKSSTRVPIFSDKESTFALRLLKRSLVASLDSLQVCWLDLLN